MARTGSASRTPKSVDGARDDVADITSFAYYRSTTPYRRMARRLAAIKDAAGNISTFSDYDVFAHP